MWDTIRSALREIHTKNASKLSFEHLYRTCYKIVLKKKGDLLYDRVKEFEEQWFASEVMPKIQVLVTQNLITIALGDIPGTTTNEKRITGEKFLRGLKDSWEDHILCMNMTTDVLMYMDRVYCADNRRPSIFTTAMGLFRDHILRAKILSTEQDLIPFDILNAVILDQIQMEREGDVIDKNLIRSCVYMLEGLYETDEDNEKYKLYLTVFEPEFLRTSRVFYQNECLRLLLQSDASTWLRQTQRRLVEEADRCRTTISPLTESKIAKVVDDELISSHLQEFIALETSGVKAMIDNDRYDDLRLLYLNVSRIDPKKEALRNALQSRVVELGSDISKALLNTSLNTGSAGLASSDEQKQVSSAQQQTDAANDWVRDVLQLKDKFDNMWKKCFNKDLIIQTALTKSFSDFINLFPRSSEYVSLYIDENLKRGIKGKTEAEVDIVLDKATTLIRYIQDKDLFERYYKKHLARRLLQAKSQSTDVERQMISRMKLEIGNYFTTKLEGMFKDMSVSEELTGGYRSHVQNLGDIDKRQIELGVNVLTSNFWPMEVMGGSSSYGEDGTRVQCLWPAEIKLLQESFTKFYLKERNGRQLSWLGYVGTADIRCTFPKIPGKEGTPLGKERRHEINVSTYGMIVMLLFNDLGAGGSFTFEEIQQRTLIPPLDLQRVLTVLSVIPKAKVLNKDPATKQVKAGDRFSFNEEFTSKSVKIKAPTITGVNKVEGEEERKDTENRNDEMRGGVIEAAIVRIMKYALLHALYKLFKSYALTIVSRQRKELAHQQLTSEVISQLAGRFRPDMGMVKKKVESLIEREYLERVEDAERPTYRYLA
jgi:cullin 3